MKQTPWVPELTEEQWDALDACERRRIALQLAATDPGVRGALAASSALHATRGAPCARCGQDHRGALDVPPRELAHELGCACEGCFARFRVRWSRLTDEQARRVFYAGSVLVRKHRATRTR